MVVNILPTCFVKNEPTSATPCPPPPILPSIPAVVWSMFTKSDQFFIKVPRNKKWSAFIIKLFKLYRPLGKYNSQFVITEIIHNDVNNTIIGSCNW